MTQVNLDMFDDQRLSDSHSMQKDRIYNTKSEMIAARAGTFTDNMKLPIHRWFKYSAGYSAEWCESVINKFYTDENMVVLDPFSGSGTTLIAAEKAGITSIGFESHPFVASIAKAKLMWSLVDQTELREWTLDLVARSKVRIRTCTKNIPPLLSKCYTQDSLDDLISLRDEFLSSPPENLATRSIIWLALTSILRPCSHVGTAQWQYILPNKRKSNPLRPYDALQIKILDIIRDITIAREQGYNTKSELINHDARKPTHLPKDHIDLVITSPPYPNNYDYADATRLEMTFWGDVETWGDLQGAVRQHIIRSCSQHSAADKLLLDDLLELDVLYSIADEITKVTRTLEEVRLTKGGRKTYHTMVAAYFADLSNVFRSIRPACKAGSKVCFVIGDSAPYGVYVPADEWLGRLAISAGFKSYTFEKLRDRNIKWKNRKHRVPLHEGLLWIEG